MPSTVLKENPNYLLSQLMREPVYFSSKYYFFTLE